MHLEKLEIQGFKSFANKNTLIFPQKGEGNKKGMTVVVGPNGSGKSNVADAVRWALGEQSMKTLRAKSGEDVIFSGSSSKGQLSMAEVSLYLNNADRRVPIDYSELVITRRLFRNGDSEYLINNSRARLGDIQILLAKANFGQKTYSVIGQGMVEGFLQTTAAERKDFFDEATGVKQFQIKRDQSLSKLISSYENLGQAEMIINEIEPRLKNLTKQVSKLKQKDDIEKELKKLRTIFFKYSWHKLNNRLNNYNKKILLIETEQLKKSNELEKQNKELGEMEQSDIENSALNSLNQELNNLQREKENTLRRLSSIETEITIGLEAKGDFDISWLLRREGELKQSIDNNSRLLTDLKEKALIKKDAFKDVVSKREFLNSQTDGLNKKLNNLQAEIKNGKNNEEEVEKKLKRIRDYLSEIEKEENVQKIQEIINKIKALITEIIEINKNGESALLKEITEKQRIVQHELIGLSKEKENLMMKSSRDEVELKSLEERVLTLNFNIKKSIEELEDVSTKIANNNKENKEDNNQELLDKKSGVEVILKEIEEKIINTKNEIYTINKKSEEKKASFFRLQREGQKLQIEINALTNELGNLRIEATKYETKLEDLENEIREVSDNIREIRIESEDKEENINPIEMEKIEVKIKRLENQYNLIGGIDPAVEIEYKEIKERYDFLSTQVSDLEEAIGKLENIIRELDVSIKNKFEKEFGIICKKFEEYFKILFNGGSAKIVKLSLEDSKQTDGDSEEISKEDETKRKIKKLTKFSATGLAGIEIQACPPGKVIKSLSMLSGGEKALTAIALICAIISANPSPFVVLDEVDAALDESNAERIAKILDDLSHKTQFIVITHNRASMRRANVLYGVTMEDNGVSKLLSVKIDDFLKE